MDSNKKEILVQRIEPYMERFVKFFKVGHIKLKEAELKELAELMKMINPRYNFRWKLNCNSCIRDVVVALSNFYSRESKNVFKKGSVETFNTKDEQLPIEEEIIPKTVELSSNKEDTEVKDTPKKKRGRPKKKDLTELEEELGKLEDK